MEKPRYIDANKAVEYLKNHKRMCLKKNTVLCADEDAIIKFLNEKCPTVESAVVWHEIKTRPLTDEEKEVYGDECEDMFDCEMPDEGQAILIATKYGVSTDTALKDGFACYLDIQGDWDDVIAWADMPTYKKDGGEK